MSYLEACILGVIQGITEFFPVSSSGHLLITRNIFNINTFDLVIEISLHLGTLMAICIYWKDYPGIAPVTHYQNTEKIINYCNIFIKN